MSESVNEKVIPPVDPPMPPKVAEAVANIMDKVPKLDKKHKNEHGKFTFASIDDFLEAVGPLMAEAGLLVVQDEEFMEMIRVTDAKGADKSWVRVTYNFTLSHKSGETWEKRPKRTAFVLASMGPQAMGAAQSYAQKQFERSLFHIPTGDAEDTDMHQQGRLPSRQPVHGEKNKTQLQSDLRAFDRDLHACTDTAELAGLIESNRRTLEQCERDLPNWWFTQDHTDVLGLEDKIATKRKELEAAEREAPQEPRGLPRKIITIRRPEGGAREFPATNAGALEALSDLEAQCAINHDAWEANKATILHVAQLSKNEEVKKRALALENEMEAPALMP